MNETTIIEPWNEFEVKHVSNTDVTRTLAAFYNGVPIEVANFELKAKIRDIQLNKKGRKKRYAPKH